MDLSKGTSRVTINIDLDAEAMKRHILANDPALQSVTRDIVEDAMQEELKIVLDEVKSKIEAGNTGHNDSREDGQSSYFYVINSLNPAQ
jgi:hypothetical protein